MADLLCLCPEKQDPRQGRKRMGIMALLHLVWEKTVPQLLTLRAIISNLTQLLAFELFILVVVSLHTAVLVAQTFAMVKVRGDFFIMIMMALDLMLPLLISTGHAAHSDAGTIFRMLRVFKGVRAVQVLRLLFTLRVLQSLQELTSTFALSGPSIGAILLLMFTCLCILPWAGAVVLCS
ncbi:cation channel sperm-associated protein 1 isoform X2 [Emydura macquarii macquarii]|uniref:cation channel sperm-associated protein 1 isoform X2 n=1 Tax=Emydura macquarii macquarii TaxID=1129001 RepID=UPI00352A564C